ncbi:Wadjet anti-phage system protein JetD domain-containing protein [Haloimpatiens sp. FM7330]|uniref:Wadjet anti-phage system protein JetD domain-containing protein n=1 Tax=Haloimpatiens sp. FM7330 TaxID=3298610 RepID=UPI00363AE06D
MKDLRNLSKKRIELHEIQKYLNVKDYLELVKIITTLINDGVLKPIKRSKLNGKKPALHNRYSIIQEDEDNSKYVEELSYGLNIRLDKTYYMKNIEKYKKDRAFVLALSKFLDEKIELLKTQTSVNERSFQIWGREKFLGKEGGRRILKNLNLKEAFLNIYYTTEPLAYYSYHKNSPQKILIIENKDTFYSMRMKLIKYGGTIFGEEIATLIYGGGKNIYKTFKDFEFCVEPYLLDKSNEILYLGDLDYEGIIIYEGVHEIFKDNFTIKPFVKGYESMIDKYIKEKFVLPNTKIGQNRNIGELFIREFSKEYRKNIMNILESDKYIPQEILNISDF